MSEAKKKIAVVLFNLGGPDSAASIKPFLFNFFMDKNIINLPLPLRYMISRLIAARRSKREAGDSYKELGDKSPLLENSEAQARALEATLNADGVDTYKTFICMRYWHPMSEEVVASVKAWDADEIVLLPLYPQFSTTTTWSSLGQWQKFSKKLGLSKPTSMVCCYPENAGFIAAGARSILTQIEALKAAGHSAFRILFSAHGLPEDIIQGGDPYQWLCEQTSNAIVKILEKELRVRVYPADSPANNTEPSESKGEDITFINCYQSRVGPKKWIGPATDAEIERAGAEGKALIIYPHAFTQEHVETLVELGIEYRHLAEEAGVPGYFVAQTAGVMPEFIAGLKSLVLAQQGSGRVSAEGGAKICPSGYKRCCMNYKLAA